MATTVSWSLTLQVSGSPGISVSRAPIQAEAVDRIEVTVAPAVASTGTKVDVDLQPGAADAVHVVLIKSSTYGGDLSFTFGDGTNVSTLSVTLDAPQIFSGGSIAVFGVAPRQLKLTNKSTSTAATVEILVARDATP